MSLFQTEATRRVYFGKVITLTAGEAQVVDCRGLAKLQVKPASGVQASYSQVDSEDATTHGSVSNVTSATVVTVEWPFYLVSADGISVAAALAIDAVPEKFKTAQQAKYRIAGVEYTKAATAALVFSAADTINTAAGAGVKWGVWLVQINAAGVVSTKSPSADQVYTSEALALAALPAVDSGNVRFGTITVAANAATKWTATTDDLVAGSDASAVNFYSAAAGGAGCQFAGV
jgi:hypothetical protein